MNFKFPLYIQSNQYQYYLNPSPNTINSQSLNYPTFFPIEMHQNIATTCNYMYPINPQPYCASNMQHYNLNYESMNPYTFVDSQKNNQNYFNSNIYTNENKYFLNNHVRDQKNMKEYKFSNQKIDNKGYTISAQHLISTSKKIIDNTQITKQKYKLDKSIQPQIIVIDPQPQIKQQFQQIKKEFTQPICQPPLQKIIRKRKISKQEPNNAITIKEKRNRYPSSKLELEKSFLRNSLEIRIKRSKKAKNNAEKKKGENTEQIKKSMPICLIKNSDNKIIMKIPQEIQQNQTNNLCLQTKNLDKNLKQSVNNKKSQLCEKKQQRKKKQNQQQKTLNQKQFEQIETKRFIMNIQKQKIQSNRFLKKV